MSEVISIESKKPQTDITQPFEWDQSEDTLREALESFVDDPKTLVAMTMEELQAELRKQLQESVGA